MPTLLGFVKEPLDQVPRAIQIRAEADRIFAIALRWDIDPSALLASKFRDQRARLPSDAAALGIPAMRRS
jgi:hypothetical protein